MLLRIAIIRLSALGDVIIASSLLGALSKCGVIIEWFVDDRFKEILADSKHIYRLHALPFKRLLKSPIGIMRIYKYCKSCGHYDAVIDMQGLVKSALIGRFLDTKRFIGFSSRGARESIASFFYTHKVDIAYDENILLRNFVVIFKYINDSMNLKDALNYKGDSLGFDSNRISADIKRIFNSDSIINVLFVLEASIKEKVYPIERFHKLALILDRLIKDLGKDLRCNIIWNEYEDRADSLARLLSQDGILCQKLPKMGFNDIKFCMTKMRCVIGGDTGITHLAWVMDTPCITLYGNNANTKGKNMRDTKLDRVLLGNPYVVSNSDAFEISSIDEQRIFDIFCSEILQYIAQDS